MVQTDDKLVVGSSIRQYSYSQSYNNDGTLAAINNSNRFTLVNNGQFIWYVLLLNTRFCINKLFLIQQLGLIDKWM